MSRLKGKVALVTGGARGIGAACVRQLVDEGATVLFGDVLVSQGEVLAPSLRSHGYFRELDVTSPESWAALVAQAEADLGGIDILVNNAAVMTWTPLEMTELDEFERITAVNQRGVYLGLRAMIEPMKRRGGGSIVNFSSMGGMVGFPAAFAYVASKWAVRGMSKAAALELGKYGIRVNSVHPGLIETTMTEGQWDEPSLMGALARAGKPEEVAKLVAYLASDDSSFTTGAEHVIDGGITAG